jgi:hypothetical protein
MEHIRKQDSHGEWKITPKDFPSMHLNATNIRINENIFQDFGAELVSKDGVLCLAIDLILSSDKIRPI